MRPTPTAGPSTTTSAKPTSLSPDASLQSGTLHSAPRQGSTDQTRTETPPLPSSTEAPAPSSVKNRSTSLSYRPTFHDRLVASTPGLAGRSQGPGRFGGMGQAGYKNAQDDRSDDDHEMWNRGRNRSQSVHGSTNQTFMQMINALAAEEEENTTDESDADAEPSQRCKPGDEDVGANATSDDTTDDDDELDDELEPRQRRQSDSSRKTATLADDSGVLASSERGRSDDDDDDDDEGPSDPPSSFLSPADAMSKPSSGKDAKSNEMGVTEGDEHVSSSIYAIHRPIAARRRTATGEAGEGVKDGEYVRQGTLTEEPSMLESSADEKTLEEASTTTEKKDMVRRQTRGRTETMASKRSLARREKLANKLTDIFGLTEAEEVIAEYPCWLFRSILLQGFVYLTTGHICFYAYLSSKEGAVVRSGALSVRSARTRRYFKHWFILKDSVLSWYPSSTDPYFPDGHIDLHYCTSVEASKHAKHFKIGTAEKRWHFSADSEASRDEWVKTLKKVVLRCQNEGESVKIRIPLETVVDIERSTNLEFAETIRIRVYDADEGYSIDDYWLSYFPDLNVALDKMLGVLEAYRAAHPEHTHMRQVDEAIGDTTSEANAIVQEETNDERTPASADRPPDSEPEPRAAQHHKTGSWSTLSSRLRLFPSADHTDRLSGSAITLTDERKSGTSTPKKGEENFEQDLSGSDDFDHRYPPDPSPNAPPEFRKTTTNWSLPSMNTLTTVPTWLRAPPMRLFHSSTTSSLGGGGGSSKSSGRKIVETVTRSPKRGRTTGGYKGEAERRRTELSSSVFDERETEEPEQMDEEDEDEKREEKVRKAFGLSEKEHIISHFPGYLFRGLPIYGKIYITTTFLCFKSVGLLSNTKMCLPLAEIIGLSRHRSYRIGYSGLIVTIKGHEEVFFELHTSERRDTCMHDIDRQVEHVMKELGEGKTPGDTLEYKEHMALMDLAASKASDSSEPHPPPETKEGQPPVMFSSTTSDFVTFKPEKSLKFTCLTIGSRGDVQPYIALCKGLMAEGHTVKIATHGEFKKWIEGHGIEHEEIGGDPAELMQLMIAHDFFTISFMKEAVGKFRGWLDNLLETTWKACQGADVLIESPSAIAGYHIAEALRIPYYRAFTMPWSRTRAYPHAFAVPDHKMGGSYNYMTYTMFDQIFWRATASQVNRWRRKTLKLGSTNLEAMKQHKIPFLYNNSPVIMPPPLDWRENIHVTGYWILENADDSSADKWEPPEELLKFMGTARELGKKIVFIGFGSIIIPDPEEMTRIVLEAVEKADVYAIVAKGWSERAADKNDSQEEKDRLKEQEKKQAENLKKPFIYNIKSVPHDWLFPKIDAAVHHGGAGTTGASLRAGLPTIIKPWFADQHFYADRVQTLGVGTAVRHLGVDELAAAIRKAVTNEKQIARADLAGQQIRKEDGVGTAIECIYRDLEYAKSLIPPPPKDKAVEQDEEEGTGGKDTNKTSKSSPANPSSSDEGGWDVVSGAGSTSGRGERWDDDEVSEMGSMPAKSRGASQTRPRQGGERDEEERGDSSVGGASGPMTLTSKVMQAFGVGGGEASSTKE